MDLLDKAEEIVMISILVLYNTNPVPLTICALSPPTDVEQQVSSVKEKLHEEEISIPTRKKKNRKKALRGVVIIKVSMRMSSGHLSIPKSFQLCVVGERRLIDDEHPSCDILTWLEISFTKPSQITTIAKEDNVKDFNDDDTGMEKNKQVPFKDLSPKKTRLNYD